MRSTTSPHRRRALLGLPRLLPLLLLAGPTISSPLRRLWPSYLLSPRQHGEAQHVLSADASTEASAVAPRRLHGKFLHITDIHPDEFYKVHSSADDGSACHHGKGMAGAYGAEMTRCDTPYALVNATFAWIAEHLRDEIDFVVWTGDSVRHDSDERLPRSAAQVQNSNEQIANQMAALFADPSGHGLVIPVVPTFGNNDILPHNVLPPGPNKWLTRYADLWRHFVPQEQRHTFQFGGWFYVEVIPNQLAVVSLNTLYFFDRNAAVDDCMTPTEPGFKQFEWLRIQLEFMRSRGVKALLMGHVAPARTDSKQLWDETCWQKYTLWLRQYRDVIVGGLFGHMNIDHFLLHDTNDLNYKLFGAPEEEELEDEEAITHRTAMEDRIDAWSTADYLQELRSGWSKLPKPALISDEPVVDYDGDNGIDTNTKKGKKKGPKLSHKWAERYQLSLVSPSIVPNYFPTLRVFEYNISGLENAPVWSDGPSTVPYLPEDKLPPLEKETKKGKGKKGKGKKGKKGKGKKGKKGKHGKNDPNLVVPKDPAKTALPGPAYSSQPMTLLGYTQLFANLTHINNETLEAVGGIAANDVGSDGKTKLPPASPRQFTFGVEYSTFSDKIYNLSDLTVHSLLEMAYRMGKKSSHVSAEGVDTADDEEEDDDETAGGDEDEDSVVDSTKKKARKGNKRKKRKEQNAVWLHFLRHAFVSTISEKRLKKTGD